MLLCRKTFETTENYIGLQNEQNDELRRKTFKTTQNNESDQITMNLHRFDVQTIKTTRNNESEQIIMNCIDLTSKRSKMLSYVAKHSKQR